jgi:FKBP-type peptidyl-prolyl cis-trans isomerase 2
MPQIKQGSAVRVHYTARMQNGQVIESTDGREPLRIRVGAGKVMRGLEHALEGMSAGETKRVVIPPEEAYGRRRPGSATRHTLDTTSPIGPGSSQLQHQVVNSGTAGEYSIVVTDKGLMIDNNPHLADKELIFDIRVVEIENT